MDPNPKSFPILSYVMNRIPSIGPRFGTSPRADSCSCSIQVDIEQPATPPPSDPSSSSSGQISDHMPHLTNPKVLAAMTRAVGDVAQTRSVLKTLGERPDHETVDAAKARLAEIEHNLSKQLEEIVLSPRPADVDRLEYRTHQAEKETDVRKAAEREKQGCKAVLQLHEMHDAYEKLLRQAEERLVKIYRSVEAGEEQVWEEEGEEKEVVKEEINEEVVGILHEADGKVLERVDLSDRQIRFLPEAFGRISGLVVLNLSGNQLQVIPDSIAGLEKLEELNASSNLLESLPDSIGLLQKLKLLNVTGNKLKALPDSICSCRSLVELDVGFNDLTYLPTNLGYELVNLQKLDIQLNKLQSIPSSVCEMRSLLFLDAHFNEIRGLPLAIGKLINLEYLNLSSNFSDLKELPDTFGDLTNLQELDLSNNQIRVLPDTFGCLDNLKKLNLEQNPIVIPPPEVINDGVEAVKIFMAKRWLEILVEVERKSMVEVQEEDQQTGWLTRSTSWLKTYALNVYGSVSEYVGSPKSPRDLYLDHQP